MRSSTRPAAEPPDLLPEVERYFTRFLPGLFGRLLIDDLEHLDARFAIEVPDAGAPPWQLAIERGRLVEVARGGGAPACRFTLDAATLLEVVAAERVPAEAFFQQRIEISGDLELGLKLSTVLEPFFERFPFRP